MPAFLTLTLLWLLPLWSMAASPEGRSAGMPPLPFIARESSFQRSTESVTEASQPRVRIRAVRI